MQFKTTMSPRLWPIFSESSRLESNGPLQGHTPQREAPPWGPTPYSSVCHFDKKKGHFRIPFITQGYKVNYRVRVLHLTYDMRTSQHFSEPISLFTSSICTDIIPRLWRQVFGRYQTLTNNTGGESMETRAHLNMGTKTFFAPLGVGRGVPGPSPYIRHWKAPGLKAPTYFNYKRKSSLYISYKGLYCNWNSFEDQGKDSKVKSSLFKTSLVMTVLEISKM